MPMGYYYGYDYTWYLLVLPAFLLALWAQFRVKATYSKYSKVRSVGGRTADPERPRAELCAGGPDRRGADR